MEVLFAESMKINKKVHVIFKIAKLQKRLLHVLSQIKSVTIITREFTNSFEKFKAPFHFYNRLIGEYKVIAVQNGIGSRKCNPMDSIL
jgi:hypothetical protein